MTSYETPMGVSIPTADGASLHVMRVGNVLYLDVVGVEASAEPVADEDIVTSIQLTDEQIDALKDALR